MANKRTFQLLLQLCIFLCGFLFWASASYADSHDDPLAVDNKTVVYDETTGTISIQAKNTSLKSLLAKISHHTNVKFLMDPATEKVISVFFEKKPLEQGLKLIMRNAGLSHATIYGKRPIQGQPQKIVPISMKILPKGKTDASNLIPVAPTPYRQVKNAPRSIFDITEKELKDKYGDNAKMIQEHLDNLKEKRSKRAAERELKRAERKQKREELNQRRKERNARKPDKEDTPRDSESEPDTEYDSDSE